MSDVIDMSQFVEAKSDQLNSDDLIGITKTITVRKVVGNDGDQPISIFYEGDNNKPFKPCKTMRRVLLAAWGRYATDYVGRSMMLYRDDKVTFGGLEVGGIRISHMSHIDKETLVVVAKSKGKKAGIKIFPLKQGDAPTLKSSRANAEQWLANFKASIESALDYSQACELFERAAKPLAKLERDHPDLHAAAMALAPSEPSEPSEPADDPFAAEAAE